MNEIVQARDFKTLTESKSLRVGLVLGSVDTARSKGDLDAAASILGSLLNSGNSTKNDEISQRHVSAVARVELVLDTSELLM